MPSTDTLTSFTTFVANTIIKSSLMNSNFSTFRGHICPVDPTATALADDGYDLGSSTYQWRWGIYGHGVQIAELNSTPSAPPAGKRRLFVKTDGLLYSLNSASTVTPVGSGGGGGALSWVEDEAAPLTAVANNIRFYLYSAALNNYLYALIKVPNGYTAGGQIYLRMPWMCTDTSGNVLMQTLATLIRSGTDAISSTTNQRTSTNAAVTLSAGTNNIPQSVNYDLTSSTGTINSVAVSANDLIIVRLTRGTDTATGDVKVPVYGAEVTFL